MPKHFETNFLLVFQQLLYHFIMHKQQSLDIWLMNKTFLGKNPKKSFNQNFSQNPQTGPPR